MKNYNAKCLSKVSTAKGYVLKLLVLSFGSFKTVFKSADTSFDERNSLNISCKTTRDQMTEISC